MKSMSIHVGFNCCGRGRAKFLPNAKSGDWYLERNDLTFALAKSTGVEVDLDRSSRL